MRWRADGLPPMNHSTRPAVGRSTRRSISESEAVQANPGCTALTGPEKRTRQTAELLGLRATVEPRLADLDCGRWRGDVLGGVRPADLAVWLTDPTRAPHGGESVVDLANRVAGWLDSLITSRSQTVAVTHPAVIRAAILVALDAPPKSFWRIDIAPVSRTVMHFRGHAWTLRSAL
jgi:broad specificity phosphatase PhoE